jgi:hypothetical protein
LDSAEEGRRSDGSLYLAEPRGRRCPYQIACERELQPGRQTQPLDGGERRERQLFKIRDQSEMARKSGACFAGGPSFEDADVCATGEDLAFGPHEQRSEGSAHGLRHSGTEVFDQLLAKQVERLICERENAQRARGFESYLVHDELPRLRP